MKGKHVKHRGDSRKYTFICDGCNKVHQLSMYAISQLASSHDVTFTCAESKYPQVISAAKFMKGFKQ